MELWDAYDVNFQRIEGKILVRDEPIPDGYYHLVCEILVKHEDNTYLLMQRDRFKHFGGMWEASAGGSALQGEAPLIGAIRELKEETGICAKQLVELGRVVHHEHHTIYVEYLCVTDVKKDSITLQPGETQSYRWVTRDTFVNLSKEELVTYRMQNFVKELQRR